MIPHATASRDLRWLKEEFRALDRVFFSRQLQDLVQSVGWQRWRPTKVNLRSGSYCSEQRRIEVHRVYAHAWVPDFVPSVIVYHEMLHAVYGPEHTPAFRVAEQRHPHFSEAMHWEIENFDRLLAAPRPSVLNLY